jgi:hydrogenase maturation factor
MCQAPIGKVISVGNDTITVEHKGKHKQLKSKFVKLKEGDYVLFSGDIAIDKVDKEEAEMIAGNIK